MRCPRPQALLALVLAAASSMACAAETEPAHQSPEGLRAAAARFLQDKVATEFPGLRAAVEVNAPDPRLRLARCAELRFFLTAGNHPYGSGSLGAQCAAPQPWALYLGYTVRLRGPALVAARPLPARTAIGPEDVQVRETAYAQAPTSYLRQPDQAVGLLTRQPVAAGQALLYTMLARPMAIRAGQKVRLVAEGAGFSVSHECTAMNNAHEGEAVRCRVPSGRILQGTATQAGTVAVRP